MITLRELQQRHKRAMQHTTDKDLARYELRSFALAEDGNGFSSISPMFITAVRVDAVASVPKGVLDDTDAVAKVKRVMRRLSLQDKKRVAIAALYQVTNPRALAIKMRVNEAALRKSASRAVAFYINASKNV